MGAISVYFFNLLRHQQTLRYFLICGNIVVNIQTSVISFMSVETCSEHPDLCDVIHVCGNIAVNIQTFVTSFMFVVAL